MISNFRFPFFFILGETETCIYQERPSIPKNSQVYIPIEVISNADLKPLIAMQAALKDFGFGQPVNRIASFVYESPHFATVLGAKIYPVLQPPASYGIYQNWQSVENIKNSSSCTFRKFPNIREAVIYLLFKADYTAMREAALEITPPPSSPKKSVLSRPPNHVSTDIDNITSVLELSSLSGLTPAYASYSITSSSSSPSQLLQLATTSTMSQSTSQPIYSHVRTLKGIIGFKTSPGSPSKASIMGARADDYLSAHGYRPGSIQLIQKAYEEADNVDDFAAKLSDEGVVIAEGRYIYTLIRGD